MLYKPMDMQTSVPGKEAIGKEQTSAKHYKKGKRGLTTEENIEEQRRLDFASAEDFVSSGFQPLAARNRTQASPSPAEKREKPSRNLATVIGETGQSSKKSSLKKQSTFLNA